MGAKTKADSAAVSVGCLSMIVALPLLAALRGWAMAQMWGWYMVPFGLPHIGVRHAFGLCLMWSIISWHYRPTKDDEEGTVQERMYTLMGRMFGQAFAILALVAIGYLVS